MFFGVHRNRRTEKREKTMNIIGKIVDSIRRGKGKVAAIKDGIVAVKFDKDPDHTIYYEENSLQNHLRFADPELQKVMDQRKEDAAKQKAEVEAQEAAEKQKAIADAQAQKEDQQLIRYSAMQMKAAGVPHNIPFLGDVITWKQVHAIWGGSFMGGIRPSTANKTLLVIEGEQFSCSKDGVKADHFYHYGAQANKDGFNQLLVRHKEKGYRVQLLRHIATDRYEYQGEYEVVDYDEKNKEFRLKRVMEDK
jgi:hypothetical protein